MRSIRETFRFQQVASAIIGVWLAAAGLLAAEGKSKLDDFDWWSLKPVVRPAEPELRSPALAGRVRTPVDRFVFARLEQEGLAPSPNCNAAA